MVVPLNASVRAYKRDCGKPDIQTLQRRGAIEFYVRISSFLTDHHGVSADRCTPSALASIVAQLRRFLDRHFGRDSNSAVRGHVTIWPSHVFTDFSETGSLVCILSTLFCYAKEFAIDSFDFDDDNCSSTYLQLTVHIEKALKRDHHLCPVKVFFAPSVSEKDTEKLRSILQSHGGAIVSSGDVATHILYPDPPNTRESATDGQILVRLLEQKTFEDSEECFVHWFYHPDSYNDWVPRDDILGHVYIPRMRNPHQPWHLHIRWLRDLDLFNEWMNELDYEMPLSFTNFVGTPPSDDYIVIPPTVNPIPITKIRFRFSMKRENAQASQQTPPITVGLPSIDDVSASASKPSAADTLKHTSSPQPASPAPGTDVDDASGNPDAIASAQGGATSAKSGDSGVGDGDAHIRSGGDDHDVDTNDVDPDDGDNDDEDDDDDDSVADVDDDSDDDEPLISVDKDAIVNLRHAEKISIGDGIFMPSFSSWFNIDRVHDIERNSFPEFSGSSPSKTIPIYKEIRNFMVCTWRRSSKQYLSATAARRCLSGDACATLRIHAFLEHWGLINFLCPLDVLPPPSFSRPPRPLPTNAGVDDDVSMRRGSHLILDDGSTARLKGNSVLKSGLDGEFRGQDGDFASQHSIRHAGNTSHPDVMVHSSTREPVEYHCDSCGTDCSELRFHCATKADVDLCASCYHKGQYSSTMKHRDFIQMTSAALNGSSDDLDSNAWTESETLLLLEALEMYTDNWEMVSEHVGTKGKKQCVLQFLRLPIEDPYLKKTTTKWWSEHPGEDSELLSPLDMMRNAGSRDAALSSIALTDSASKKFSGQTVVCGDKQNTVVPFVGMLSSLCAPAMMNEVVDRMEMRSANMRHPFETAYNFRNGKQLDTGDDDSTFSPDAVLTNILYKSILQDVKSPSDILRSRTGESLVQAIVALISYGSIEANVVKKLKLKNSDCDIAKRMRVSSVSDDVVDEGNSTVESAESGHQGAGFSAGKTEEHTRHQQKAERASSSAVSMAALLAACISASQLECVEDVEIGRLRNLITELKRDIVRRKLHRLADMVEGGKVVEGVVKRNREEKMCKDSIRKRRRVSSDDEPSRRLIVASKVTDGISVAPTHPDSSNDGQSTGPLDYTESNMTCYTFEDGAQSLLPTLSLPDFSEEVTLDNVLEEENALKTTGLNDHATDNAALSNRGDDEDPSEDDHAGDMDSHNQSL